MSEDRAREIIRRGDAGEILAMALNARWEYEENGNVCTCAEPILHGRDLMCGHCLLENMGQREARERQIREPHPFELSTHRAGRRLGWCEICTMPEDDPRHTHVRRAD